MNCLGWHRVGLGHVTSTYLKDWEVEVSPKSVF